jgi:hypothetical protein
LESAGRSATQTHWTSVAGDIAAICGVSSVRTSVRQQPILSMWLHCPCIARQQALSLWFITTLAKQAITGEAAVSRRRIATTLSRRRITISSIRPAALKFVLLKSRVSRNFDSQFARTGRVTQRVLPALSEFRVVGRRSGSYSPELEPDIVLTEPQSRHRTPPAWMRLLHTPW